MLRHLHIKNYALIDSLDIDFGGGFSVVTGETGAGKSIILGALGLLLGQRADARTIKAGEKRCVIEAEFTAGEPAIRDFLHDNDLEADDGDSVCVIRREVLATGKSRAFVNDTPATVAQLKELGDSLVDIHSQHQNLLLAHSNFQLRTLDTVAGDETELSAYCSAYKLYRQTQKELAEARQAWRDEQKEQDYMQFQFSQLDEARLHDGEQEELEARQRALEHAEETKAQLYSITNILDADETGLLSGLRKIERGLQAIAPYCQGANELSQRVATCHIEMKDVADEVASRLDEAESDPEELGRVEERLSLIYDLLRKHHADTVQDLLAIHADLKQRLSAMQNRESDIAELEKRLSREKEELASLASALTASRKKAAVALQQDMLARLRPLGMPNIQFSVAVTPLEEPSASGADSVLFSFSANKNTPMQPISQVASGGEIARVMLALKSILGRAAHLPAIIFDEIDTGVSGRIAESMAALMREMSMSEGCQVITITHLPQIASLGQAHYRVFKEEDAQEARTRITLLNPEERLREIAHMLSGSTLTQAALDNAKELLSHSI